MTCTDRQIGLLMKNANCHTIAIAAAKAGLSTKTAAKYLKLKKSPSELKTQRQHRTRHDPFAEQAEEITKMFKDAPQLQANTILEYLMEKYPDRYGLEHSRSLRRRLQQLRAEFGKAQQVMFCQDIKPGLQSQSDWTCMNDLKIEIAGTYHPHLLFHFMLPFSCWESVMICYSESLETLTQGYEHAVWQLGGVFAEHRTDNLSAATQQLGSSRQFTARWSEFLEHYSVKPSRNNPGESHENGSVEKSHDLLKKAINQQLLLRGSRNFCDIASYQAFLDKLLMKRNAPRKPDVAQEMACIKDLPDIKYNAPQVIVIKVRTSSTIKVLGVTYSVPSRLIGFNLQAHVYASHIELYYGAKKIEHLTRLANGEAIDYRHIIDSLVRKPGAFSNYQYRASMFPNLTFKIAHEDLQKVLPERADRLYLQLLKFAKLHGEVGVTAAIELAKESGKPPLPEHIKELLDMPIPSTILDVEIMATNLSAYDNLHNFKGVVCH